MKTLTIKQPFASLIVENIKDIENRTWKTNFRGRVLIHAGMAKTNEYWMDYQPIKKYWQDIGHEVGIHDNEMRDAMRLKCPQIFGAIIGSVEIVDCVINHPSIWAEKTPLDKQLEDKCIYNWVLANPIKFDKPIPCKGKLSFWDFDETLIK